ncbi:distal membrane-arm assembly complex protein 2 [Lepisosteus oculatus]|uniref:distal membrane-arm assembly complex protein 2 n=1 Tax=Lepisosteus oculatus TaxID=7918 RepID=UPI0037249875
MAVSLLVNSPFRLIGIKSWSKGCVGAVAKRCCSSSPVSTPPPPPSPLKTRAVVFLSKYFNDVEWLVERTSAFRSWMQKFSYYGSTLGLYGDNMIATFYILRLGGSVRFAGHSEWFRQDSRGRISKNMLKMVELPVDGVDASGTLIDYDGLDYLVSQSGLRTLSLSGCPKVDGWFLSRLYVFRDSLEELNLSGCPNVTEGALASLHHLRNLRRLELSLPASSNPGLVRILLEEVLPDCHVAGIEYNQGLRHTDPQGTETDAERDTASHRDALTHRDTSTH